MNRKVKIISLVLVLISLSFFRENFFKNLNEIINHKNRPELLNANMYLTLFNDYNVTTLIKIKWIGTLFFTGLFLAVTLLFIPVLFNDKKYNPIIFQSYLGILLLSGTAIAFGLLIPAFQYSTFYFARWMMGTIQSPLLTAILCLFIYYQKRNNN